MICSRSQLVIHILQWLPWKKKSILGRYVDWPISNGHKFLMHLKCFFFFLSLCVNDGLSLFSQNVLRKTQDFASEDLYVHVPPDQISFIYIYNVSQKYLCVKNTYLSNLFVLSEHRMYRVVQRKRSLFFQFRLSLFYLCSECTGWFRNCGTAWSWEHIRVQGPQESGGVGRRYTGVLWGGLHFLCLRSAYLFLIHH